MNPALELIQASYPQWVLVPTIPDDGDSEAAHNRRKRPVLDNWAQLEHSHDQWRSDQGALLVCGEASGVVVIDLDDMNAPATDDWLEYAERYDPLVAHTQKGFHLFIEYDEQVPHRLAQRVGFDIRTTGGGIKLPGDPAEPYRQWHAETPIHNSKLGPAGPALKIINKWLAKQANSKTTSGRSPLADLLNAPPAEGGRNDYLAQVAGHLVKLLPYQDAFEAMLATVNRALTDPLPEDELAETVAKQWDRYKHLTDDAPDQEAIQQALSEGSGAIAVRGREFTWVHSSKEGEVLLPLFISQRSPWPVKQTVTAEQAIIWSVDVGLGAPVELSASTMGDQRGFTKWCASHGLVLSGHKAVSSAAGRELLDVWLRMGVEKVERSPHWGWDKRHGEWVGLGSVQGPASYDIKLGHNDEALVPTMHEMVLWQDAEPAAVFCAWVAAQAVKGLVEFSFEPNMVIRGRAGSGKSRGLFAFGARLTGSPHQASASPPVVRDSLGWHRNGIVVLDDLNSTTPYEELYRQSAQSNSVTKKSGAGWTESTDFPLLGSMLVSGEAIAGFTRDKALLDRSIVLEIESMQGRASPHDSSRSQWADIMDTCRGLGAADETAAYAISGSFVAACIEAAQQLGPPPPGARATGIADMLTYGAAVWEQVAGPTHMLGGRRMPDVVEEWCARLGQGWRDLTLVRSILPAALRTTESMGFLAWRAKSWREVELLVHPGRMSDWWIKRHRGTPRQADIGGEDNIRRELRAIHTELDGGQMSVQKKVAGINLRMATVPWEVASFVLDEAGLGLPDWAGDEVEAAVRMLKDA